MQTMSNARGSFRNAVRVGLALAAALAVYALAVVHLVSP
jgi:hypothetical protein